MQHRGGERLRRSILAIRVGAGGTRAQLASSNSGTRKHHHQPVPPAPSLAWPGGQRVRRVEQAQAPASAMGGSKRRTRQEEARGTHDEGERAASDGSRDNNDASVIRVIQGGAATKALQ